MLHWGKLGDTTCYITSVGMSVKAKINSKTGAGYKMSAYSAYKTPSLLKDNSWIRKVDDEDEAVDRDPNFGKTVLSQVKTDETSVGPATTTTKTSTSVQALSKRFTGSQDKTSSSTLPSRKTSSYSKSTYSSPKSDSPISSRTSSVSKDGTTTETTFTATQSLKSPVLKSPTMTETFSQRVKNTSKETLYSTYSPTKTTRVTERTISSSNDAEDKLFDTLIPSKIKDINSPTDSTKTVSTVQTVTVRSSADTDAEDNLFDTLIPSKIKDDYSSSDSERTISSTEYVTVRSSSNGNDTKATTTTRSSASAEDDLYGTLLPKSITNASSLSSSSSYSAYTDDLPSTRTSSYTISSTPSDDYSSDKTFSYSKPNSSYEYTSISSPTSYSPKTYRSNSRSDDMTDSVYSSSSKSVYAAPERTVLEKDLCSYCRKPFTGDAKMVLDDMKINCHTTCFKCEVCNSNMGHMKAGDSMWIYKHMVHCENCFDVTREKWRR
ncbi:sciellin isoform X2 [Pseudochaenichthys georgianus]|uniref:sciellin isoform X2 n=1 Tax=Pseudochaenichthys georgianus TaxID=52239 RepID=UPI00146D8AC0|nr:sciellin isoform X2 [Pseudochaenichthys georgianus]